MMVRILAISLRFHLITPVSFFRVPFDPSDRSFAKSILRSFSRSFKSESLNSRRVLTLFRVNYLLTSPLISMPFSTFFVLLSEPEASIGSNSVVSEDSLSVFS